MKEAKIKSNQTKRSHHPLPHPPSSPSHPTSSSGFHKRDQSRAALAYTAKYKVKHMKCATQFGFVLLFSLARWKVHRHVQKQTFKMIRSYLLKSALTRFIQQVHLNTLTTISNKNTAVFAWWVWRLISQKASVLPSPQYQCGHHQKQTLHSNTFFIQISLSTPIIWTTTAKYQEAISRTQGRHKSPCSALENTQSGMRVWNPVERQSKDRQGSALCQRITTKDPPLFSACRTQI